MQIVSSFNRKHLVIKQVGRHHGDSTRHHQGGPMPTVTLRLVQAAERGASYTTRRITGHMPCGPAMHTDNEPCGRDLIVIETDEAVKILAADTYAIVASGDDLRDAADDLADIHDVTVEFVDLKGRTVFTSGSVSRVAA
jgi:hypothetical protein